MPAGIEQIAARLQGYDPQALSAQAVGDFLAHLVEPVADIERVALVDALGRVLAHELVSPIDVPPHDNSAMDGYAFDGAQLRDGQPLQLEVVGTALAGKAWQGTVAAGQCVKIMTGAVMPAGLDTVVPQELCVTSPVRPEPVEGLPTPVRPEPVEGLPTPVRPEPVEGLPTPVRPEPVEGQAPASTGSARTGGGSARTGGVATRTEGSSARTEGDSARTDKGSTVVVPAGTVRGGDNRRVRGEDLAAGQPALSAGERLGPAALGLVASLGIAQVEVLRRVKVAYFSTGDEILSLGERPREGAVYDSNRYTVRGMLASLGCELIDLGVVRDEPAALRRAFVNAATQADAIITSGGVSVGEADYTKAMMKELGDVAFWRIAMRPGRPMAVGRISAEPTGVAPARSAVLFGLPGNPVAVMVTFLAFVRPALLRMMGAREQAPVLLRARSAEAMRKKPGRTEYQRGIVTRAADGSLSVRTTGNQGSGVLSSMAQANGLVVLHHAQASVAIGDEVDVMMFEGVM